MQGSFTGIKLGHDRHFMPTKLTKLNFESNLGSILILYINQCSQLMVSSCLISILNIFKYLKALIVNYFAGKYSDDAIN